MNQQMLDYLEDNYNLKKYTLIAIDFAIWWYNLLVVLYCF